jgi:AbrB family looped-hinge helix DNA binding protein
MKCTAKITSKGQITIPAEVRRALGVDAGDSLTFEKKGSGFRVVPGRSTSPFAKFRGSQVVGTGYGREDVIRAVRELRGDE